MTLIYDGDKGRVNRTPAFRDAMTHELIDGIDFDAEGFIGAADRDAQDNLIDLDEMATSARIAYDVGTRRLLAIHISASGSREYGLVFSSPLAPQNRREIAIAPHEAVRALRAFEQLRAVADSAIQTAQDVFVAREKRIAAFRRLHPLRGAGRR